MSTQIFAAACLSLAGIALAPTAGAGDIRLLCANGTKPGIEIVGPLPAELQSSNVFSAAVLNMARDAGAAKSLVDFLRTAESASAIKAKGMEAAGAQ
jgi:molybdate transport system substrate-binding protein